MPTVETDVLVIGTGQAGSAAALALADSPYLDSDAVFGVKGSLVRDVPEVDDPARAAEAGLPNPFRALAFDVVLLRADQAPPAAQPAHVQPTVVAGAPAS